MSTSDTDGGRVNRSRRRSPPAPIWLYVAIAAAEAAFAQLYASVRGGALGWVFVFLTLALLVGGFRLGWFLSIAFEGLAALGTIANLLDSQPGPSLGYSLFYGSTATAGLALLCSPSTRDFILGSSASGPRKSGQRPVGQNGDAGSL